VLDIEDVSGKRILQTRIHHTVTLREERAIPALEVMNRFAIDPRWLIYLPPTMSPCETAKEGPHLEHPREALAYYRGQGVERVICEEKHMGSRAVLVVCRDAEVAERRFHLPEERRALVTRAPGAPFLASRHSRARSLRLATRRGGQRPTLTLARSAPAQGSGHPPDHGCAQIVPAGDAALGGARRGTLCRRALERRRRGRCPLLVRLGDADLPAPARAHRLGIWPSVQLTGAFQATRWLGVSLGANAAVAAARVFEPWYEVPRLQASLRAGLTFRPAQRSAASSM
jgi:hypothetical protein